MGRCGESFWNIVSARQDVKSKSVEVIQDVESL
jgi:hypothetical protein